MSATLIDGKAISQIIRDEIKNEVSVLQSEKGITPGLAVILIGEDPASQVYVRMKHKACEEVGFKSEQIKYPETISEAELLYTIELLNKREDIHGILVQLPLPKHIRTHVVLDQVIPSKDVDCFHPYNVGRLLIGEPLFAPCTPSGVQELLKRVGIKTSGKHVVILGRSNIVGKPMAALLLARGDAADATITICHSKTRDIASITRRGDILIAAIGHPHFVTAEMVSEGAVVIDVGINRVSSDKDPKGFKLVGDVDTDAVQKKAAAITPVPGGVGPMTIAMLLKNTLLSAKRSCKS